MNGIGEVLHVLRISAGRTQAEVAEHLGITQAAFSRYENDLREPDPDTLARIADAFGVTPEFWRTTSAPLERWRPTPTCAGSAPPGPATGAASRRG